MNDRLALWLDNFFICGKYIIWGSGLGTFPYIESIGRTWDWAPPHVACEHPYNEYLETVIAGGLLGAALGGAAIISVWRLGYRACSPRIRRSIRAMAMGGLLAFTTLVLQSIGDFGFHVPAMAILATVLAAQLCALGDARRRGNPISPDSVPGRYGPPVMAGLIVLLGLVLYGENWRLDKVERLRLAAAQLRSAQEVPVRELETHYLDAAARLAPGNALVQLELGHAHSGLYEALQREEPGTLGGQEHLYAALKHFVRARDLCPTLARTQIRLANYAERFQKADSPYAYLERAKYINQVDPQLWYLVGLEEFNAGLLDQAWASWRGSLAFDKSRLETILRYSAAHLSTQALLDHVLPVDPYQIRDAAAILYPTPEQREERRPFIERAIQILKDGAEWFGDEGIHDRALLHLSLGQSDEALASLHAALDRQPRQTGWRYELAQVFVEQDKLSDARRELLTILSQEPENGPARQFLQELNKKQVN